MKIKFYQWIITIVFTLVLILDVFSSTESLPQCLGDKVTSRESANPKNLEKNKWSYHTVSNTDQTKNFSQEEVLIESYPSQLQHKIEEMLKQSGDGWGDSIEVGFFNLVLKDEIIKLGLNVTSNSHGNIAGSDLDKSLDLILKEINFDHIKRIQFYHTHPRGPMAMTISKADVDEVLRWQEQLRQQGIAFQ